jgi:hypothetical protein
VYVTVTLTFTPVNGEPSLFPQNFITTVETRMFLVNSLVDSWQALFAFDLGSDTTLPPEQVVALAEVRRGACGTRQRRRRVVAAMTPGARCVAEVRGAESPRGAGTRGHDAEQSTQRQSHW